MHVSEHNLIVLRSLDISTLEFPFPEREWEKYFSSKPYFLDSQNTLHSQEHLCGGAHLTGTPRHSPWLAWEPHHLSTLLLT